MPVPFDSLQFYMSYKLFITHYTSRGPLLNFDQLYVQILSYKTFVQYQILAKTLKIVMLSHRVKNAFF